MRNIFCLSLLILAAFGMAQAPVELSREQASVGQSVADELRSVTQADAAFVAAGMLKDNLKGKDLAQSLQFPTDELVVVKLTGRQIKEALERAMSLHPASNPALLYFSGIEATVAPGNAPENRVSAITIGGNVLNADANYRVAMPTSLARGGLGYFTVWSKSAIEKSDATRTLESVLKGKMPNDSPLRWRGVGSQS